jgi:hypothetical protein
MAAHHFGGGRPWLRQQEQGSWHGFLSGRAGEPARFGFWQAFRSGA